jgi:glutathione S-transferase
MDCARQPGNHHRRSFGLEPTEGELVAATRTRYILSRSDARARTVHVHFPRIGYQLRAVKPT